VQPHQGKITLFKAARRCYDPAIKMLKAAGCAQPPEQIQVFKQSKLFKASDLLVERATNENT